MSITVLIIKRIQRTVQRPAWFVIILIRTKFEW